MENGNSRPPLTTRSRLRSGLPLAYVQEVIGIQHLVIIEYLGQQLFRRFQEVIRRQLPGNIGENRQLIAVGVQEVIDLNEDAV